MSIKLNEVFQHTPDSDSMPLSDDAQLAIIALVRQVCYKEISPMLRIDIEDIKYEVEWVSKTGQGSLVKRIGKWLHKKHSIKLSEKDATRIGNVIATFIPKSHTYTMDIVRSVDWNQGDFGDMGSCFWTCQPEGRDAIQRGEYLYCLRFFKECDKIYGTVPSEFRGQVHYETESKFYIGSSRCWLYHNPENGFELLFNGYGIPLNAMAIIYASHKKYESKRVRARRQRDLYVNHGEGYAIGPKAKINALSGEERITINERKYAGISEPSEPPVARVIPDYGRTITAAGWQAATDGLFNPQPRGRVGFAGRPLLTVMDAPPVAEDHTYEVIEAPN